MYPCNFLSYLRNEYGQRENLGIFSHTIKVSHHDCMGFVYFTSSSGSLKIESAKCMLYLVRIHESYGTVVVPLSWQTAALLSVKVPMIIIFRDRL